MRDIHLKDKYENFHANLQTWPTPSTFTVKSAMKSKISSTRCKKKTANT